MLDGLRTKTIEKQKDNFQANSKRITKLDANDEK
uniref:Uncharacterized protein n=1 Tax=Tetranychus urticae TaxID=32264 RepID=T1KJU4_TETUR